MLTIKKQALLAKTGSGSEYYQSDSFKKNKNRLNNPLREKRMQLLHDQEFMQKHQMLGQFIYSKNKDVVASVAASTGN